MNRTVEIGTLNNVDDQVIVRKEIGIVDVGVVCLGADLKGWIKILVSGVECSLSRCRVNYCDGSIAVLGNYSSAVRDIGVCDARSNGLKGFL